MPGETSEKTEPRGTLHADTERVKQARADTRNSSRLRTNHFGTVELRGLHVWGKPGLSGLSGLSGLFGLSCVFG